MKTRLFRQLLSGIAASAMLLGTALPAFAQEGTAGLNASVTTDTSIELGKTRVGARAHASTTVTENQLEKRTARAQQEISRRTKALSELNAKVQASARLSPSQKSALTANIQSQVTALTALSAKIAADTDAATLSSDIRSITASYRIFLLVIPQGRITVAAEKIQTTSSLLMTFATKLSARIGDAQKAGKNVDAASQALADLNAKISDANVQASAAISAVVALKPDTGDSAVAAANTAALKDARAKIKVALEDLKTARKDARAIVDMLKAFNAAATTTVQTR